MSAAKRKGTSIGRAGFATDVGAKRSYKAFTILPSKIKANHDNNYARAAIYSLAEQLPELADHPALESERVCFTRDEVLERVASFQANSQRTAIKVWRTNTHVAYVAEGYLRHLAALFMEVTGELAKVSDMRDGLRCEAEEQPKSPEDQVAAAWSNHAENADRKATSPIDDAWLCKRLTAMQVPRDEIAKRLGTRKRGDKRKQGVSKRTVDRLLSLLALPIDVQLAVHEGRVTVSAALKDASKKGQGTARGSNGGVSRRAIRRRSPNNRPSTKLTPEQIDELVDAMIGDKPIAEASDAVAKWLSYLDAPKPPREPKKPRKKAPPSVKELKQ